MSDKCLALLFTALTIPAQTWLPHFTVQRLGGSGSQSITAIAKDHEQHLYIAGHTTSLDLPVTNASQPQPGNSTLLQSEDNGRTWQSLPQLPATPIAIAIHPTNPSIRFAATHAALLRTNDNGITWETLLSTALTAGRIAIALDPADPARVYLWNARNNELNATNDGGLTWRNLRAPTASHIQLTVDPAGSGAILLGDWISRDRGTNWTRLATPAFGSLSQLAVSPQHPGWLYGLAGAARQQWDQRFVRSRDWGATWEEFPTPFGRTFEQILIHPEDPETIHLLRGNLSQPTHDGGRTWEPDTRRIAAILPQACNGGGAVPLPLGPSTATEIAVSGCTLLLRWPPSTDAFVAKLTPDGRQTLWLTYLGGLASDQANAIAVDDDGRITVSGTTTSADFPLSDTAIPQPSTFLARFDTNGNLLTTRLFSRQEYPAIYRIAPLPDGDAIAIAADRSGDPVLFRWRPGQPDLTYRRPLEGFRPAFNVIFVLDPLSGAAPAAPYGLAVDRAGFAYVGGANAQLARIAPDGSLHGQWTTQLSAISAITITPDGHVYLAGRPNSANSPFPQLCLPRSPSSLVIARWNGPATLLNGCNNNVQDLQSDAAGNLVLSFTTFGGFPLRHPVLTGTTGPIIARITPDGELLSATYAEAAGPAVPGADGEIFAPGARGGLLRLPPPPPVDAPVITGAWNAFNGVPATPTPNLLLHISGEAFGASEADVGLNSNNPLPDSLADVQVLFNGVPAGIFRTSQTAILCSVPTAGPGVAVQVIVNGNPLQPFILRTHPHVDDAIGFLTQSFPNLPPARDLIARNADGTLNSPQNPAAPGSRVTLFATGLTAPGNTGILWNAPRFQFPLEEAVQTIPATVRSLPGFIPSVLAVDFTVPDKPGPGVYTVPRPGVLTYITIGYLGEGPGLYIK